MSDPPAGSLRDTPDLARRYSRTSHWQRERGLLLVDLAAPREGEQVVDLGCGTGELSDELARRVGSSGRVIAVDPDPARLQRARATVGPGRDNLSFAQATAEDLACVQDGSVDLVYSNYAIHWVLDQPAMLDEVRRVLRPQLILPYAGLPSVFDWLEATSHGAFDAERLPSDVRRDLESRYPGEIACLCKAFRMALASGRQAAAGGG
jgi:ubiquinone/menaquinone biosynthesis C-methylase UbiE